jgi:hypothetical protein
MTRDHGPAWSTSQAPVGLLQFRMVVVTSGYDGKWVWVEGEVLPCQWEVGWVYDAGVQITDVPPEGCYPSDTQEWQWHIPSHLGIVQFFLGAFCFLFYVCFSTHLPLDGWMDGNGMME